MTEHPIWLHLDCSYDDDITASDLPSEDTMRTWVATVLTACQLSAAHIHLSFVDTAHSERLNISFRGKTGSTNVLSFPYEADDEQSLQGDLILCVPIVHQEAVQANIPLHAHWAHLLIHGTLHLYGMDHIQEEDAEAMEALESQLMQDLGFDDPHGSSIDKQEG